MIDENGRNTVTINKETLLGILRENRSKHNAAFEIANKEYREQSVEAFVKMASDVRAGGPVPRGLKLVEPEDHTMDYDRAIRMLELSVDDTAMIEHAEFVSYVMDDWAWKDRFRASTQGYVESANAKARR